jgi:hypothetical protein
LGRKEMEEEILVSLNQMICRHKEYGRYAERSFDILSGFEVIIIRCSNCHKTLTMTIKGMHKN